MSSNNTSEFKAENLFNVQGWVAVVTGGGTGLGLITAKTLLANGAARVYITGRRESVLQKAVESYDGNGTGEIIPIVSDVSKKDDIEKLVEVVKSKDKYINLLVNNASVGGDTNEFKSKTGIDDISRALFASKLDDWNTLLHLNTSSLNMYVSTAAFLPLLVAAKERFPSPGSIINVSSMSGITKQTQGGQFAYNSAKAATIALTQQLAYEFRIPDLNVRVNTIAPGYFPSEMTPAEKFGGSPEHVRAQWGIPAGRLGLPTEYAQALISLAVNGYANGSTVLIDGGWLLQQS
ncbi:hypothetical protein BU17DRAFT_48946 [Hysterangium stoloniferum]|nr:hypothetical protein BU17DRAFT_48946 [Hysterangium stoloniferum]